MTLALTEAPVSCFAPPPPPPQPPAPPPGWCCIDASSLHPPCCLISFHLLSSADKCYIYTGRDKTNPYEVITGNPKVSHPGLHLLSIYRLCTPCVSAKLTLPQLRSMTTAHALTHASSTIIAMASFSAVSMRKIRLVPPGNRHT